MQCPQFKGSNFTYICSGNVVYAAFLKTSQIQFGDVTRTQEELLEANVTLVAAMTVWRSTR